MDLTFLATTNIPTPGPLDPVSAVDLLYYAALLAGMGGLARQIADDLSTQISASTADDRTCIDAGSPLMFSLLAPGPRCLRVLVRQGVTESGCVPWLRTYYLPGGDVEQWRTLAFVGEPGAVWKQVCSAAERAGGLDILHRTHAILGPYSRLYSVNWRVDKDTGPAWVGWHLDRTLPVPQALEMLGWKQAWPTAVALWEALFGQAPHPRFGPWSLSILLGGEPRWRLGSTNWTRRIEDVEKRRRFVTLVDHKGGDRRFAESLYRLVESVGQPGRPRAIGRAVELELMDGQAELAEFYLRMP
jgi:hypothetical protein